MSTIKRCWIFIVIVCLFFVGSSSFAQGPKSRPSGWDKGEKRGWGSDVPPGLEKKGKSGNYSDDDSNGDEVSGDEVSSDEESSDKDKKKDKKKRKENKKKSDDDGSSGRRNVKKYKKKMKKWLKWKHSNKHHH